MTEIKRSREGDKSRVQNHIRQQSLTKCIGRNISRTDSISNAASFIYAIVPCVFSRRTHPHVRLCTCVIGYLRFRGSSARARGASEKKKTNLNEEGYVHKLRQKEPQMGMRFGILRFHGVRCRGRDPRKIRRG